MNTQDTSWTRALMASSGIAIGHEEAPRHESPEWYEAGAGETPLGRLQKLATSRDAAVRTVIVRRADCPMGILAALAFDHSSDVRAAVAGHPRITEAVSAHLAKDRDTKVVKALARNHAIDLALLERLALHRKDDVRRVASRNLDERVHGASDRVASVDTHGAPRAAAAAHTPTMPMELRDRVEAATDWLPMQEEHPAPSQDARAAAARPVHPLVPRLHPQ